MKRIRGLFSNWVGEDKVNALAIIGVFLVGGLVGMLAGAWFNVLLAAGLIFVCVLVSRHRFQQSGEALGRAARGLIDSTPARPLGPVQVVRAPSNLERQVMDQVVQRQGDLSVSALAEELSVSEDAVKEAIDSLVKRKLIVLGSAEAPDDPDDSAGQSAVGSNASTSPAEGIQRHGT